VARGLVDQTLIYVRTPINFRKLRITWTVFCGIAAVLVIVLWVRSYWWSDAIKFPRTPLLLLTTFDGRICMTSYEVMIPQSQSGWAPGWGYLSGPIDELEPEMARSSVWYYFPAFNGTVFTFPYWLPVLLAIVFAGVPWLRRPQWHFSLRTLLIATTLVAVVLGLIVWSVR
jgi:hypothetical protein